MCCPLNLIEKLSPVFLDKERSETLRTLVLNDWYHADFSCILVSTQLIEMAKLLPEHEVLQSRGLIMNQSVDSGVLTCHPGWHLQHVEN